MRTDLKLLEELLNSFPARRTRMEDGVEERRPVPFAGSVQIEIDLSQNVPELVDVWSGFESRRSTLQYSPQPVDARVILGLAQAALERDCRDWHHENQTGHLEAFVFVHASNTLPPGVYRVTANSAERIASAQELGPFENLGIQREFATAAGIIAIYGSIDRADSWAGSHGYRILMTRGAMALYDLTLKYQRAGFVGTIFGGFIGAAVRTLVQSDGVTRHPLVSATYALPASEVGTEY